MQTNPFQRHVKASDLPLDRLMGNHNIPEHDRIQAAGRAFEAVFLRQILESAQKNVIPNGISTENTSSAIYRDMITNNLADSIARSGQFGLARSYAGSWERPDPRAPADPAASGYTTSAHHLAATTPTPGATTAAPSNALPPATLKPLGRKSPLKSYSESHSPTLKPYRHE